MAVLWVVCSVPQLRVLCVFQDPVLFRSHKELWPCTSFFLGMTKEVVQAPHLCWSTCANKKAGTYGRSHGAAQLISCRCPAWVGLLAEQVPRGCVMSFLGKEDSSVVVSFGGLLRGRVAPLKFHSCHQEYLQHFKGSVL